MAALKREVAIAFALAIVSVIGYSEAFDSFWSVQQWPPGVCAVQSGNCVGSGLRMFTIHGLWPQQSGKSLLNCPGNPFDINQISSKITNLNNFWPDIIRGNNQNFWSHEWTKHGTCSEPPFDQAAYFQLALDHRFKFDIMTALRSHAAGPNGQKKATQAVKSFIQQAFGKFPGLRCKTDTKTSKSFLVEVVLCFGQDAVTLIDCQKDTCGADFYF